MSWYQTQDGSVCTVIQDEDEGVIRSEHVRV